MMRPGLSISSFEKAKRSMYGNSLRVKIWVAVNGMRKAEKQCVK